MLQERYKTCANLVQERWHSRRDELEKFDANGWDMFHEYGLDFSYVEPDTSHEDSHRLLEKNLGPSEVINQQLPLTDP